MLAPCKDCQDRHPNCHSTCEKYAEFKAENERRKAAIAKDKDMNYFMYEEKRASRRKAQKLRMSSSKMKNSGW